MSVITQETDDLLNEVYASTCSLYMSLPNSIG